MVLLNYHLSLVTFITGFLEWPQQQAFVLRNATGQALFTSLVYGYAPSYIVSILFFNRLNLIPQSSRLGRELQYLSMEPNFTKIFVTYITSFE